MSRIELMVKSYIAGHRSGTVSLVVELQAKGKDAGIKIVKMQDVNRLLQGLPPLKILGMTQGCSFNVGKRYAYIVDDYTVRSMEESEVYSQIMSNIEFIAEKILAIPPEELTPEFYEVVKKAKMIDDEIAEQKKNYKKTMPKIQVPDVPAGSYDDYSEVREENQTSIPLHMTIA